MLVLWFILALPLFLSLPLSLIRSSFFFSIFLISRLHFVYFEFNLSVGSRNVHFLDVWENGFLFKNSRLINRDLFMPDCVHPSSKGYKVIIEAIKPYLQGKLPLNVTVAVTTTLPLLKNMPLPLPQLPSAVPPPPIPWFMSYLWVSFIISLKEILSLCVRSRENTKRTTSKATISAYFVLKS